MNVPATPLDELLPSGPSGLREVENNPSRSYGGCDAYCCGGGGWDCAGCAAPDGCFDGLINLFAAWYDSIDLKV